MTALIQSRLQGLFVPVCLLLGKVFGIVVHFFDLWMCIKEVVLSAEFNASELEENVAVRLHSLIKVLCHVHDPLIVVLRVGVASFGKLLLHFKSLHLFSIHLCIGVDVVLPELVYKVALVLLDNTFPHVELQHSQSTHQADNVRLCRHASQALFV